MIRTLRILIPSSNLAAQFLIGVEAAVAVSLLCWLNTEDVSRYFKRSGERANTPLQPTSGGGASSYSTQR